MNKIESRNLYRADALAAQRDAEYGEIVMVRPVTFSILTGIAVVIMLSLAALFCFGTYTKSDTVTGQLVPDSGLIQVHSTQSGIIIKKLVAEGQSVERGDVLFVLSSERQIGEKRSVQATINADLSARRQTLNEEKENVRVLQDEERSALTTKINGLQKELREVEEQITTQESRIKLANENVSRYQELLSKHFVSNDFVQKEQGQLLDQVARKESLAREESAILEQIEEQRSNLSGLPYRTANQISRINRDIDTTNQEMTESEAKRELLVTAPASGIATAILAEVGQAVDPTRPLISIVPKGAALQAHLYVPSRAIGFVHTGDEVIIRYQAFPYQKFGQARGVVDTVSKTTVVGNENTPINVGLGNSAISEPMYRVTVRLTEQAVVAYGKAEPLQAGMLLSADILHGKKKLYEFVIEPLGNLAGTQ